jgi:PKD repeat protein
MTYYQKFFKITLVYLFCLILMLAMTGSAAAETDDYLGVAFHPFTLDGDNNTCVPWTDSDVGQTRNCDPVNLVFPGRTWMEVRDLLLDESWSLSGGGSSQWLHYDGQALYIENEQLYKPGTIFGPRYHIRLWQAPGNTLVTFAAVHHEDFFHNIDMAWEQAESNVANALCAPACEQSGLLTQQDAIQGEDGEWRGWANNGSATVIPAPSPTDLPPTVDIVNPADAGVVSGLVPVQIQAVDDNDPAGTLVVEWNIDGGAWLPAPYNSGSGYYEATWDSAVEADGAHTINAQATDSASNNSTAGVQVTVDNLNDPPQARFTYDCTNLSCNFDASASSDSDGTIVEYAWDFGDSSGGSGVNPDHIYANAGAYNVELTVTDDDGATGTDIQSVSVSDRPPSTMHVGDLEGTAVNVKKNWLAQLSITVHADGETLVSGAEVSGSWGGDTSGTVSCTTDDSGVCSLQSDQMPKKGTQSAIFLVTGITHATLTYDPAGNHDPQGDSSGTAIQVNKDGTTQIPGELPNQPPLASFTYSCDDLTLVCTFDATNSWDPDGTITSYGWDFGHGDPGSGVTANHTYPDTGTYTVILTVTDDGGASGQEQQTVSLGQPGGDLTLTATGYKVKGVHHADLTWSGATSENVEILRDGELINTGPSAAGAYMDIIGRKGGASYVYQVCEAGTATCSNEVIINF